MNLEDLITYLDYLDSLSDSGQMNLEDLITYFDYLDSLSDSGHMNMCGFPADLVLEFSLSWEEALRIFREWRNFDA